MCNSAIVCRAHVEGFAHALAELWVEQSVTRTATCRHHSLLYIIVDVVVWDVIGVHGHAQQSSPILASLILRVEPVAAIVIVVGVGVIA